jgi:hypothetical protein
MEEDSEGKHSKHRPSYFTPKIKFSVDEDTKLKQAVSSLGTKDWQAISMRVGSRNPRQCRERWKNYLNPDVISTDPWTPEEDDLLLLRYQSIGPKWTALASLFPSRSTNSVKNRYHTIIREAREAKRPVLSRNARKQAADTTKVSACEISGTEGRQDRLLFLERGKNEIEYMLGMQMDPMCNWNGF